MKRLRDCLGKMIGKLISKADADMLAQEAYALEAEGMTPIAAEQRAVQEALDQVDSQWRGCLAPDPWPASSRLPPSARFLEQGDDTESGDGASAAAAFCDGRGCSGSGR